MNLKFYLEKLYDSNNYKKFIKENPSAFLCSGFFSIDKVGKDNKQHFDFYVDKKIFSFQLEENCKKVPIEIFDKKVFEKINQDIDFDFDEVEEIIFNKLQEEGVKNKIEKILLSLQNLKTKDFLIGTVFVSGLGIIKINIDIGKMKVTDFEKKSFFDMVKLIKKK